MFSETLTESGLKEKEAIIYNLLLEQGSLVVSDIIKKSRLKRGIVYATLYNLEEKGLVSKQTKKKKLHFRAEHPNKILELIEYDIQQSITYKKTISSIMPVLSEMYNTNDIRPIVKYYEGLNGIKTVFKDIYSPKNEPVYGCVDFEKSDEALPKYIVDKLIPLRIKNNLKAISFIGKSPLSEEAQKKDFESLRKSFLLDKDKYPLPAEIDVYEDKVAMLSFDKNKFAGIVLQNKDIATSLKSILKLAFDKLSEEDFE